MTLDEFLRTLESLIDQREDADDDPGEGNFSCEDCHRCSHCRFCIGCEACEDCTYCEECLDCTGCTQSKRCVGCEKVSYCEDCRDCKDSRYLTLCVDCTNSVHCLACVGIDGGEFHVLNEKRTRKEYFALLRQVQEMMRDRMAAGWRPPGIGLASEIFDVEMATRDVELHAAPWLDVGDPDAAPDLATNLAANLGEPEPMPPRFARGQRRELDDHIDDRGRPPGYGARERSAELREGREPPRRASRSGRAWGEPLDEREGLPATRDHQGTRPSGGRRGRGNDTLDVDPILPREGGWEDSREQTLARPRRGAYPQRGADERRYDEAGRTDERRYPDYAPPARGGRGFDERGYDDPGYDDRRFDERRQDGAPGYDAPGYGGHHEGRSYDPPEFDDSDYDAPTRGRYPRDERRYDEPEREDRGRRDRRPEPEPLHDEIPDARDSEPSSPWLDEGATQARRRAKRGSLRRAGRPKRKPTDEGPPESTSTGSYRTGSAPERTGSEGTHTGTGLRLGRKPKRRR